MDPKDIVIRLLVLMRGYVEANASPPAPIDAMTAMWSPNPGLIDPSSDPVLRALGVGTVVPWIERLGTIGLIASVGPLRTGWIGFHPSPQCYDMLGKTSFDAVLSEVLDALFPSPVPTPNTASVAVAGLRKDIEGFQLGLDPELLRVVLRELRDVCQIDCRHATIALCGKLLELALGAVLRRWGKDFGDRATLDELTSHVRNFAGERAPRTPHREEAAALIAIGVGGHADLIRTVRNGAVHARHVGTGAVELPSREQADGVVLLVVDVTRRCFDMLRAG